MNKFYCFKSFNDNWSTPKELYEVLNQEFHFVDDPCPLNGSGGLQRAWNSPCYVNPPYSNPNPWISKAVYESGLGKTVVMLLKADTSTLMFHNVIYPSAKEIRFIKGRLRYSGKKPAPFPSMVVVF